MYGLTAKIKRQQAIINSNRPLSRKVIEDMKQYYRIGLVYSSNALEGNTLTISETKVVLEDGITIGGKSVKCHLEAIGHSRAFDFLWSLIDDSNFLNEKNIKNLHRLCVGASNPSIAGKYRRRKIYISGSDNNDKLPPPTKIKALMTALLNKMHHDLNKVHPVELAVSLHKNLVQIHPFEDGNGRTARLLMNLFLLNKGYPIVIIPAVLRSEYIRALEKAWTNDNEFSQFMYELVDESQRELIRNMK